MHLQQERFDMKNEKAIQKLGEAFKVWEKAAEEFYKATGVRVVQDGQVHMHSVKDLVGEDDVVMTGRPGAEFPIELSFKQNGLMFFSLHRLKSQQRALTITLDEVDC